MSKLPLEGMRLSVKQGFEAALREASTKVFNKILDSASLEDHSLDELAKLGHPYALRSSSNIHSPSYQVHKQSGRLADAIQLVQVNQYAFNVGIPEGAVPYLHAVVYGTRYMKGRDFIHGSLNDLDPELRALFSKALTIGLVQASSVSST